jgi:hypothetical protein
VLAENGKNNGGIFTVKKPYFYPPKFKECKEAEV